MNARTRLAYAAVAAAAALWGLGFVFGKIALAAMPVGAMIVWRFAIACLALAPFVFRKAARPLFAPRTLGAIAIAGILYVPVQFLVQFQGLKLTSLTHASLMVAVLPGMIAVAAVLVFRQRLSAPTVFAVLLSVAGAAIIVLRPDRSASIAGDVLVLLSLVAAVAWVLFTERYLQGLPPVEMTAVMLCIGSAGLFAVEAVSNGPALIHVYPAAAMLATAASGLLCTAASTVLWNAGLRYIEAARAGVFLNFEPLVGALCGVTFFSEPVSAGLYLGGALVIGGAIIVQSTS